MNSGSHERLGQKKPLNFDRGQTGIEYPDQCRRHRQFGGIGRQTGNEQGGGLTGRKFFGQAKVGQPGNFPGFGQIKGIETGNFQISIPFKFPVDQGCQLPYRRHCFYNS